MQRIPFKGNKKGVLDNLVASERVMMARKGKPPLINIVNFPKSLKDIKVMLNAFVNSDTGLNKEDVNAFSKKLWQLMTSCYQRRNSEYERISWWQFTEADQHSKAYQEYFVGGITRTLVAAKPKKVSSKTGGDILLQLLFLMANPHAHPDRVLNGPTNESWLYPWRDYLIEKGVKYHHGHTIEKINCREKEIISVDVSNEEGKISTIEADYFISAVPVERMAELLNEDLIKADPTLANLQELKNDTAWMTGIQFYLNKEVNLTKGHVMFTDSPWALTAISQLQFWKGFNISDYYNGKIKTVLSVDISDWDTIGNNGKIAKNCTKEEIKTEVWQQLKEGLVMEDGSCLLADDMLETWYLDRDIEYDETPDKIGFKTHNEEPLLVNRVRTWDLRPDAYTGIPNLFLASDYVRTYTDLATMEGANEAARRAVNVILEQTGSKSKSCEIWKLHEPNILAVYRWFDKIRYNKGLPWKEKAPLIFRIMHYINVQFHKIFKGYN